MPEQYHLDPAGTRPYLINNTRRTIHSTDSEIPFCQPEPGDNIGFADAGHLEALALEQKLTPCAYCLRDEGDAILASL